MRRSVGRFLGKVPHSCGQAVCVPQHLAKCGRPRVDSAMYRRCIAQYDSCRSMNPYIELVRLLYLMFALVAAELQPKTLRLDG